MKYIFSLLTLLSATLLTGSWAVAIAAPMPATAMIVVVKPGKNAHTLASTHGVTPKHVYTRALNGFAATLTDGQRRALERHADVVLTEADQSVAAASTQTINTTTGLWGLDRLDQRALPLSGSYSYTATGAGVTAYLIDSGLQTNHPEFGSRAQNVFDAFAGTGNDCHGHGTHLASLLSGTTYGVAKGVQLRGVRVLDCNAQGTVANAIAGIDWVAANAQHPAVATLAVAPVNLTSGNSVTLQLAVENLTASGVFVAVAAGNSNVDACTVAPANVAAAYTVASTTRTDARATFSNYGACVDSYAPGSGITGAWIGSATNTQSGTSQAAAFVAGGAALFQMIYGAVSPATITSWLNTNATTNVITGNPAGTPNRLLFLPLLDGADRKISAGYLHTCAVRTDRTIVCWGRTTSGQATPPGGMFQTVSAGGLSTCAVRTDSTLACWGANDYGQGTPPSGMFQAVSAGSSHTCAVRTDGTVACWGRNDYGQGTPPSGMFQAVSAGYDHSCGLRTNGMLACWGRNNVGQATAPSGMFQSVSAGYSHSCGVRTDGSVACWGDSFFGQATGPSGMFQSVSAGGYHSCGVRTDGALACWGYNSSGQATGPSGTFQAITAGDYHSCGVRTDGTLACWGANDYGQASPPSSTF